jgi:hypothetical protein
MTDTYTPHEAFRQLALDLGARSEDEPRLLAFDARTGETVLRLTWEPGSLSSPPAFTLHANLPGALVHLTVRREKGADRFGKAIGVNREVQLGDEEVDRAVYLETDASAEAVRAMLESADARRALREVVQAGYTVHFTEDRITARWDRIEAGQLEVGRVKAVLEVMALLVSHVRTAATSRSPAAPAAAASPEPAPPTRRVIQRAVAPQLAPTRLQGWQIAYWLSGGSLALASIWGFVCISLMKGTAIDQPWGVLVALSAALWIVGVVVSLLLVRGRYDSLRRLVHNALLWIAPAMAFGFTVPHVLNRTLATAPTHSYQVVSVKEGKAAQNPRSDVRFLEGPRQGKVVSLPGRIAEGKVFSLSTRVGRLGWEWQLE